ncbi:glycoside hydrolase family 97 protein [Rhodocytophaga aerolata]|uniref:Glycoside hydrolase family 97 protein n=1 Tax=Rhodocytophaga aerolata TaxID=455078 RepID=A0ABT8RHQ4_9BACT|nr:glycoside hydrolase family 97 protein [Rhodocytophaga aerolata]MDO1451636.1 glycoside hydrolase family 97 protein [Rhodocytophaga aerolata]
MISKVKFFLTLFIALSTSIALRAQQNISIASPNQAINLEVLNTEQGILSYSITYKSRKIIEASTLGFSFSKPALQLTNFTINAFDTTLHDDTWKPVWGEVSHIRNYYKQLNVRLEDKTGSGILLNVVFRIFNDGVGFRYEFPQQASLRHFIVSEEHTQFRLAGDHKTFWIPGDYETNEYGYHTTKLSEVDALAAAQKEKDIALTAPIGANAVQTPLMMKTAEGLYINLHEAALRNYPVMNLMLDKKALTLTTHLVPDAVGNKAYLQTPAQTPWRTVIVSDKAAGILASKMILNLNEPSLIGDAEWVKPQKYVGMWWEMHVGKANWPLADGKHGANTRNVKSYIDFAAKYGFKGVLVEGWNTGWEDWFGNWKEEVFDFVTPYPDYDIKELSAYAKAKGVRIIMHHETSGAVTNYERRMDTAYRFMQDHGMNMVKTGYVGRIIPRGEHHDGQWMVNHYERVAQKTAQYKIMLVAHESVRPTGLHRTYPNWLANEAARGSEFHNAPTLGMSPEHTTILPFTRGIGGPMDFTPGFFHFQLNQFDSTRTQKIRSTLAKQLALYVTMYSPVQMAADLPENYNKHLDAFQFIVDVPVDWADTQILEAEPGDYLTIARKEKIRDADKGKEAWFVGAITDENPRTASIALTFLKKGKKYEATLYRDANHASWEKAPEAYTIEKRTVTNKTRLNILLASGGGCAISLIEK